MVFPAYASFAYALVSSALVFGAATPTSRAVPSQVQLIGRIPQPPLSPLLTWAYTGLKFSFNGTQANVTFTATGQNGLALSIDGSDITTAAKTVFSSGGTFGTGVLQRGVHTVEIHRVTETDHGTITLGSVVTDGTLLAAPVNSRRIEFIGDSITVGYGVDGSLGCSDSAATNNAGKTYAAILGRNFSADVSLVAWSGRGIIRNYPDANGQSLDPTMPVLWKQTSSLDTTATYKFPTGAAAPQAVVVNLGTNDFAYLTGPPDSSGNATPSRPAMTQAQYASAMKTFIQQIQSVYPSAKTFLVSSPMLSDGFPAGDNQHSTQLAGLKTAASGLNNVFVVDLPSQTGALGCDFHPSPATHAQMASILGPVMKAQLGW